MSEIGFVVSDFADLIPDTFDFSEDASGKRKSRSKFRLKLNNAVISRSEVSQFCIKFMQMGCFLPHSP